MTGKQIAHRLRADANRLPLQSHDQLFDARTRLLDSLHQNRHSLGIRRHPGLSAHGHSPLPLFTENLALALIAGCAAVAGHNYSPYLKFRGGKGIATMGGLLFAIHPLFIFAFAVGILSGLFLLRNMIWGVFMGIVASGIFLWLFRENSLFLAMTALLLLIIIPKYINHSIGLGMNFKFRKEKTVRDLFTPKIR